MVVKIMVCQFDPNSRWGQEEERRRETFFNQAVGEKKTFSRFVSFCAAEFLFLNLFRSEKSLLLADFYCKTLQTMQENLSTQIQIVSKIKPQRISSWISSWFWIPFCRLSSENGTKTPKTTSLRWRFNRRRRSCDWIDFKRNDQKYKMVGPQQTIRFS